MADIQKPPDEYFEGYDSEARIRSYDNQVLEVCATGARDVLEIGIGNGYVTRSLREKGIDVVGMDFDSALMPDVAGDVRMLPFGNGSFDLVLCAQVLEHMEFGCFVDALSEVFRVAKRGAVISLPESVYPLWYKMLFLRKTLFSRPIGEHYWEIGWLGFPIKRVVSAIESAGFRVEKNYVFSGNRAHRFFLLEK